MSINPERLLESRLPCLTFLVKRIEKRLEGGTIFGQ